MLYISGRNFYGAKFEIVGPSVKIGSHICDDLVFISASYFNSYQQLERLPSFLYLNKDLKQIDIKPLLAQKNELTVGKTYLINIKALLPGS